MVPTENEMKISTKLLSRARAMAQKMHGTGSDLEVIDTPMSIAISTNTGNLSTLFSSFEEGGSTFYIGTTTEEKRNE